MDDTGFFAAWLIGEAIVVWRQVNSSHRLPVPGQLLGVTALFAALGLIADVFPNSRRIVLLAAFGLDLAGVLNLPSAFWGQVSTVGTSGGASPVSSTSPTATSTPAASGGGSGGGLVQDTENAVGSAVKGAENTAASAGRTFNNVISSVLKKLGL